MYILYTICMYRYILLHKYIYIYIMLYVICYEHRISPYRWSHIGTMMADVKMATCRCLGSQFSETGSNILLLTMWPCWPLAFLRATHTCLPRFLDVDHFQRLLYIIYTLHIYIHIYCYIIYMYYTLQGYPWLSLSPTWS